MADVKWIKITTDMFEDEKIDFIVSLPESDAILVIWIRLLALAGKCNAGGYIYLTEKIPYTEDMLSHKFRKPINIVKLALDTFKKLGMMDFDENGIFLPNWDKHQNIEGLEKIKEQTAARVARHRLKQRQLLDNGENVTHVTQDVTLHVTHGNATDIDKELDIELDKDKSITTVILNPDEAAFISVLETIKGYPNDRAKDIEMYKTLGERYPSIDLLEAIKDWSVYKLDHPLEKGKNPRSQINTSFKNCVKWGKNLKSSRKGVNTPGTHQSNSDRFENDPYRHLFAGEQE